MMVHFLVFDPLTGLIQRFGVCPADDLAIQGDAVLALEDLDPTITDATHRVDVESRTLIPLEA